VDSDLRELERLAQGGDDKARLRFFAAAARSDDPDLALIRKIEDRVYAAAMLALAVAERGGLDPESSRFWDGRVIEQTLLATEDDCVRTLARCVRRLSGSAAWGLVLLKRRSEGAPFVAGVLAGKSTDGHVALAVRSKETVELGFTSALDRDGEPLRLPYSLDDDLRVFSATLEPLSLIFGIHVLPSREDLNEARRAMRRARGGPLVRPRVAPPAEAIATWAEYAPERRGRDAWIDDPEIMSPTYANGTRPIVIAPANAARRWASLWP